MNNILKNLITGLILVSIISLVQGAIIPEKTFVSMENGKSVSVLVEARNDSSESITAELIARASSNDVKAQFAQNFIQLNGSQRTTMSVSISSELDAEGTYNVELLFLTPNREERANIEVSVFQDSFQGISLITFPKNVCRNQNETISIQVQNNTSRFQSISLNAESELFLPIISPSNLELGPGESEFVEMEIHSNNTFRTGTYSINVFAQTSNQTIQSTATFSLVDCLPEQEKLFDLRLPTSCQEIQKNKTSIMTFTLTNLTDELQSASLGALSDVLFELNEKKITLEPKEQKAITIEFMPENATEPGRHEISVFAYNIEFSETENTCVIVRPQRLTKAELLDNYLNIERGSSETFEIKLTNLGDQSEKFFIRTGNVSSSITVKSSAETVVVPKKETRTVFINVFASLDAPLGSNSTKVFVQSEKINEITLNFTIKPQIKRIEQNWVEFISFPSELTITQGESRAFSFTIENISGKQLEGLKIRLEEFPATINMSTLSAGLLEESQKKSLSAEIFVESNVEPNTYTGFLVIENDEFKQKVPLIVKVASSGKGIFGTGLALFEGSLNIGLIGVIALLIILFILASASKDKAIPRRYYY